MAERITPKFALGAFLLCVAAGDVWWFFMTARAGTAPAVRYAWIVGQFLFAVMVGLRLVRRGRPAA